MAPPKKSFLRRFLAKSKASSRGEKNPEIQAFSDFDSYLGDEERMHPELSRRKAIERKLAARGRLFDVKGYCYVCDKRVPFRVDFDYAFEVDGVLTPNWRERLACPKCYMNNRLRASVWILERYCRPEKSSRIYLTEQNTVLFREIRFRFPNTVGSEYLGESIGLGGYTRTGIRNEDLTRLTFPNDAFDVILSFDVFEHVSSYQTALAECFRCLAPGGTLLFSVPFNFRSRMNVRRAQRESDGSITHLLTPAYHGDPLSADGILCFHDFGWELLDRVRDIGFTAVSTLLYWSLSFGYLGIQQAQFVASKPS